VKKELRSQSSNSERGSLRAADPFACELFNSNVLKYVKGE